MVYAPGTQEKDLTKLNMSLQQNAAQNKTNASNITTLQTTVGALPGTIVSNVATAGLATGGPITSTGTITVTAAVQSDQETATSTSAAVVPAVQQFHPSAAKAWVNFTISAGTVTVRASYNVTSVTRNSAGDYTVNFTTAFSSANAYATLITTEYVGVNTDGGFCRIKSGSRATGSVGVQSFEYASAAFTFADPPSMSVVCFGDL